MSDKKWIEGLVSTIYDKNKGDFTADDWETGAAKNIIAKTVLGLNEYPLSIYKAIFEIKSRYKDISWLSDDSFSSLLIHLRNIVYSKIESHALSACIVVAKTQSAFLKKKLAENFSKSVVVIRDIHKKETGKDNVVSAAHLKTLSKYYTLANPRTSIFVYSDKKKFLGMFDIKKSKTENQMLPYDKMAEFTADCNAFVLLTEENRNCIRMFFCGRHIAD
ncbi:MAG: hypothetical protein LBJ21_05155, partial [Acidobacteriota bacterium]|nr:hypothetical protein [Acidobacteriota bacterium]